MSITIEVDLALDAAYIKLSEVAVQRTVEVSDDIQIDLDEFGVAVGIEVLSARAPLPFAQLVNDYHVHSEVVDLLRLIRPDVDSFLQLSHGNDGTSSARAAQPFLSATAG